MSKLLRWAGASALAAASVAMAAGEPLTVAEAVRLAERNAPSLAAARAAAAETAAAAGQSRSAFAPQAFVTTTPGYASGLPVAVAGSVPSVAGAYVRETLYDPTLRVEALDAEAAEARANAEAAAARADAVERTILAYARAQRDDRIAGAADTELESAERAAARLESLLEDGRIRPVDADRARIDADEARERAAAAHRDRETDLTELRGLVGWKIDAPLELTEDPLEAIAGASVPGLSEVVETDPEIQALEVEEQLAERSASVQRRFLAPVVAAEAQYLRLTDANGFSEFYSKFKADDWSIGLTVAIPIWTGGRFASGSARSAARAKRLAARRRVREAEIALSLQKARGRAQEALARNDIAHRRAELAGRELADDRALEEAGRVPTDTVETRERALSHALEASARAGYDLVEARVALLRISGGFDRLLATGGGAR